MQMNIDDIKISDQFLTSHPSPERWKDLRNIGY